MKIKLFSKEIKETTKWAKESGDLNAYIEVSIIVNRHVFFTFCVNVMNKSFCYRNPIKAILKALESETVGMCKYDALKERVREIGRWSEL